MIPVKFRFESGNGTINQQYIIMKKCNNCKFLKRVHVRDVAERASFAGGYTTTLVYKHKCSKSKDVEIWEESFDGDDYLNLKPTIGECPLTTNI